MRGTLSLFSPCLRAFGRCALLLCTLLLFAVPQAARADPADIDAAARGVVRIVIIEQTSSGIVPVSHGTGFAVTPERVVTNAHVVEEARTDRDLSIGIVPSDGGDAVYGRLLSVSPRNDLALIAPTAKMNLPPLTLASNAASESGPVTAVGYPMNVDRAQGLSMRDMFRAQPPVKSTGFLSGSRPTREFDSLLHTAPIARGNSGGPLLDDCGRVIGANSFGAESGGADAEFFFAVSIRELMPFLRANDVTPQVNGLPCRSIADIEEQERERTERVRLAAQAQEQADQEALALRRDEMRREVQFAVMEERENGLVLTIVFLALAIAAGSLSFYYYEHGKEGDRVKMKFAGGLAGFGVLLALLSWITRPGYATIEDELEDRLRSEVEAEETGVIPSAALQGSLTCVLDTERSRITTASADDVPLEWSANGCADGRFQFGYNDGEWTQVHVPASEAAVSVSRFDPQSGEYRIERFLLDREDMARARTARADYDVPMCKPGPLDDALASSLGQKQAPLLSLLPERPNERLVYNCQAKP